jgi:hypothetical protein
MLCGNCGQEGQNPAECPSLPEPKMLVRYVHKPAKEQPKPAANARLVYYDKVEVDQGVVVEDEQVRHVQSSPLVP